MGSQASLITGTVYGLAVLIASWFSGTLSSIWGPQRVMQLGAAIWVVFEVIFLLFAINSGSLLLVAVIYGIRGFAYPLFAFGFLVWIQTVARVELRGSAAGWFWFAFTGGLPTLGSLVAAFSAPIIGVYNTFWLSLGIVAVGGLIGSFAVREAQGAQPIADEEIEDPTSYARLLEGIDILWRDPRTTLGGVVRIVNTAPEFGFFFFLPFVFVAGTASSGFMGGAQYSLLISLVYAANIFANLFFRYIRRLLWVAQDGNGLWLCRLRHIHAAVVLRLATLGKLRHLGYTRHALRYLASRLRTALGADAFDGGSARQGRFPGYPQYGGRRSRLCRSGYRNLPQRPFGLHLRWCCHNLLRLVLCLCCP